MWPSQTPSGSAISVAISVAASDSCRWVQVSSHISPRPPTRTVPACDSRSWKMNSIASPKGPSVATDHRLTARSQGVAARWTTSTISSSAVASRTISTDGGDDVAAERRVGEDLRAEAAGAGEEREAGDADRRRRRDPQPREDRRQRHRQLDPEEDLAAREAHALRRVDHLPRHLLQPGGDVAVDQHQRVGRQHHHGGGEAAARDVEQDQVEGDRGDREQDAHEGEEATGSRNL